METPNAIAIIDAAKAELDAIKRGKQFAQWQGPTKQGLDYALSQVEPFSTYGNVWIFTGDDGRVASTGAFGSWVVRRLVAGLDSGEIIAAFEAEAARNAANYAEESPILGVTLDTPCDLGDGVTLTPPPEWIEGVSSPVSWPFNVEFPSDGTGILRQSFTVTPAFERRKSDDAFPTALVSTSRPAAVRSAVRTKVRLACLLVSRGPVELPLSLFRPDEAAAFAGGAFNFEQRPIQTRPRANFPMRATEVAKAFAALNRFGDPSALERAIDRLGRSRVALNDVDRALELGMAIEIALMHGKGSNTEITQKIGTRAAWLVGKDVADRLSIFEGVKKLYDARSTAVHTGALSNRAALDLVESDALVSRVLLALAMHARFPDWSRLTLGGGLAPLTDERN